MTTPAGWYPDPNNAEQHRYWDGANWTSHTAPRGAAPPSTSTSPTTLPSGEPRGATLAPSGRGGAKATEWIRQHKVWVGVGTLVVLVAIVTGSASGSGDKGKSTSDSSIASATSTLPTTAPSTSEPEATPTPSPSDTPIPKAKVYRGSGDDVIRIKLPDTLDVLTATYSGYSNFIVDARGKHGLDNNLINVIGHYHGTTALNLDGSHPTALQVQASGPWKFKVASLSTVPRFGRSTHGVGDAVIAYSGRNSIFTITSDGRDNIIVDEISKSGDTNLVNEIGHYRGTVFGDDGPAFIVFQASGRWTIRAK